MKKIIKLLSIALVVSLLFFACNKHTSLITTVDQTLVQDIPTSSKVPAINDIADFDKYGYGTYHIGPGIPYQIRTDLMPSGYNYSSVTKAATLLRFFTISDIHLTDIESPAQLIVFANQMGGQGISLYSPLMPYTTQVLNAAIKTINDFHKQVPFDLGLSLGDMANSTQHNELRYFIDIMDGQPITPYSGTVHDPIRGANNDYTDKFQAVGLDKSIPWYATIGNHDHFFLGSIVVTQGIRDVLVGSTIYQSANVAHPDTFSYSCGTLDASTPNASIIGAGRLDTFKNIPTVVADSNRRSLAIQDFIKEFSTTTSSPVGHGFIQSNPQNVLGGCYSFIPKSSVPIKIIVLDDTQADDDPPFEEGIYGHGELSNGRYDWLMNQLQAGQDSNQLMIIAAHVPIGVVKDSTAAVDWKPEPGYTGQTDLIKQLQAFPNLILWVAGHRHLNTITEFVSSDSIHPENGFWEVETRSLREFPEEFRTFDINRNSDSTISIITTDVDPVMENDSLAALGRKYAIASNQIYGINGPKDGQLSFNAILIKQLSPTMKNIIAKIGN
jgi:metallophosphoesterase (TIGR03768 family)